MHTPVAHDAQFAWSISNKKGFLYVRPIEPAGMLRGFHAARYLCRYYNLWLKLFITSYILRQFYLLQQNVILVFAAVSDAFCCMRYAKRLVATGDMQWNRQILLAWDFVTQKRASEQGVASEPSFKLRAVKF